MSDDNEDFSLPEVVSFESNGITCKAFVTFDQRGINMRSCQINLGKSPKVGIEYLPGIVRVSINDGQVWFDTTEQSAVEIESLFDTGKAPSKIIQKE